MDKKSRFYMKWFRRAFFGARLVAAVLAQFDSAKTKSSAGGVKVTRTEIEDIGKMVVSELLTEAGYASQRTDADGSITAHGNDDA